MATIFSSHRSNMIMSSCAIMILVMASCVAGCHKIASKGSKRPKKPTPDIVYDSTADVWLGAIEFVDFFCGTPDRMKPKPSVGPPVPPALYSPAELNDKIAQSMQLPKGKVNPYKFDHSFVYFRGKTFEWGASVMTDYSKGTIGRDPHICPAIWSLQKSSNCSLAQAERIAAQYSPTFGQYNLLTNNCHHFAEWLMNKLIGGHCV